MPESTDFAAAARRCWGGLEPLHVVGYFAPEPTEAYVALGLHKRLSYFAARSAAMGPVDAPMTIATFYVFAPRLVEMALPAAWDVTTPDAVTKARRDGVTAALRRILDEPDVTELLDLARTVCDGLSAAGRPLYAAHSTLDWPTDPLTALWHAAGLIREHRGDGHIAVLQQARLDPVEALILGGLFSDNTEFVRTTRGWTDEEWADGKRRLSERGLLTEDGDLSEAGRRLRQQVEDDTDALAVEGWLRIGPDGLERCQQLAAPLRNQVLASGVLPGWISRRG